MNSPEYFDAPDLRGISVITSDFVVATADSADSEDHSHLSALLRRVRELLKMDVAFVAEFVEGHRVFRHIDATNAQLAASLVGAAVPLEETYCQRVVDGRLPLAIPDTALIPEARDLPATAEFGIAAYLTAPIVLSNGNVYGTLCCLSHETKPGMGEPQVKALNTVAALVAASVERREAADQHPDAHAKRERRAIDRSDRLFSSELMV